MRRRVAFDHNLYLAVLEDEHEHREQDGHATALLDKAFPAHCIRGRAGAHENNVLGLLVVTQTHLASTRRLAAQSDAV